MDWRSGDRLIVRGAGWRILRSTRFSDCLALDLEGGRPEATRTVLLPFDRPRKPPRPRLTAVSRRRWAHEVRRAVLSSFPYGGLRCCPSTVRLMPYQLEPALAFLRHGAHRVLVADDVGLGKTIEAGLVVRELAGSDRSARILILCPAALRTQWANEMDRLFELQVIDAGASWLAHAARELPSDVNPWSLPGIYLASIDFVKRAEALRPLEDVRWDLVVVDEAHIATLRSDRRAAIDALSARARRLMLLTATPHPGDDEQFRALCALGATPGTPLLFFSRGRADTPLGPSPLRSIVLPVRLSDEERRTHRLLDEYARRLWLESERRKDRGARLVATVLSKRALSSPASLAASVLRRRALLPARQPAGPAQILLPLQDDTPEDDEPDTVLGLPGLLDSGEELRFLDGIAELASAAVAHERKACALLRLLRRAGEAAIVFSEYRDTATRLCALLTEAGHRVLLLHGGLPHDERGRAVAEFAAGRSILVATDAASEGLNLHHACRLVVHFELPWTPSRLHQRCGRVDRIGQTRRVHEIALVAYDTSEQLVLAPLIGRATRSGALARTALVQHLTESRVAAHVLGGCALAHPTFALPPGTIAADLGEEASVEVRRLELLRRLGRTAGTRVRRSPRRECLVPLVRVPPRSPHFPSGLHVIYSVREGEQTGETLSEEIVVLSCDARIAEHGRRSADLRAQVLGALAELEPELAVVLDRLVSERVAAARPLREAAARALEQRQKDLERHLPSAAEELVQAGLFDRRALRARAARTGARQSHVERGAAGALEGSYELVAVLIGGPP